MPSTNGHGPKRAILYARVSTDEQARSGYSLGQQLEALREYATREGYEVLKELTDPGQSGASLERPGMDRVRDLVAGGGVSVVLAQDRDRFAREPAYHYLLRREFEEHGAKLRSLNDRGDDSPEGELTDGILDQLGKYERAKIAERSRRGKLRKAREGKILAGRLPDYGFAFNDARDNYVVDEEKMAVIRRIFCMVGMEGKSLSAVKKILTSEGLPSPGGRRWEREFIRSTIKDDVYKPHSYDEVAKLVTQDVAARLDPGKCYGIWWFNQRRVVQTQISENGENGRHYRKRTTTAYKPREEWIAVPVPDSGISREWVDAAREVIKNNRVTSSAGRRFWELSGGICYCGGCGTRMMSYTTRAGRARKLYHYYRCRTRQQHGKDACAQKTSYHAHEVEAPVWDFVSGYLNDPDQLRLDLERMLELEREGLRGNPAQEAKLWLRKLVEVDQKRSGFQDMAAEGLIAFDELRTKLAALEETRQTARCELATLEGRRARVAQMERDRDALLEQYETVAPDALDTLTPEERQEFYKTLKLRVTVGIDGGLELTGAFLEGTVFCSSPSTQSTFMQFRAANAYLSLFPATPTLPPVTSNPGEDGVYVTLDQWDGYQAERDEIIEKVGGAVEVSEQEVPDVKNFVTITGDIHSFIAGYIKRDFNDTNPVTSPPQNVPGVPPPQDAVGVEFVCGSVTSANLTELATFGRGRSGLPDDRVNASNALVESNNRHFKYFNSETHGYNIMEVTPDKLTCTMKAVSTIKQPEATLSTLKVFEVPDGVVRIDDVTPSP